LPSSYFLDKSKFDNIQAIVNKVIHYFDMFSSKKYGEAEILFKNLDNFYKNPDFSEEGNWFRITIYAKAMATWVSIKNWTYNIYFFRQLPKWIRDEYFKRHPESKMLVYNDLERFLEEPLRQNYGKYAASAYATRLIKRYTNSYNIPYQLRDELRRKMVAQGIWESRRNWTSQDWNLYWYNETLKRNNLQAEDLSRLPLMRSELKRVVETFPLRKDPQPFKKSVPGRIQPFF
jgi:hypothetical protein